ncbi:MAG: hypothetical protein U0235_15320 [Polyangiaceae bacterium]
MRAPLYASSEFPNANPDLHAGRIDPYVFPDVEDAFGDGDVLVVDDLPELASSETEIEIVGQAPEAPRDSMIRLVAAVASHDDAEPIDDAGDDFDLATFSSLTLPTLPPIAPDLFAIVAEADVEQIVDRAPLSVEIVAASAIEESAVIAIEACVEATVVADPIPAVEVVAESAPDVVIAEAVVAEEPVVAESIAEERTPEPVIVPSAPRDEIAIAWKIDATSETANDVAEEATVAADEAVTDPFVHLVRAICSAAKSVGADAPETAMVELLSGRPVPSALFGMTGASLVAAGIAVGGAGESLVLAPKTEAPAREWAKIVRDEGGDFEACGGKTLDEFAAEIAAAIAGDRSKLEPMRRALRADGVAAYGIVVAA